MKKTGKNNNSFAAESQNVSVVEAILDQKKSKEINPFCTINSSH